MSGPSQPKVEGEQWSDERIQEFLALQPRDDTDRDFHVLQQAYVHMIPEFFERFLGFFVAAGRNLHARSAEGQTLLQRMGEHKRAAPYIALMKAAGASE